MATIINKSEFHLSIVGVLDGAQYKYKAAPGASVEVPDKQARHWSTLTKFVKQGKVLVSFAPSRSTVKSKAANTPPPAVEAAAEDDASEGSDPGDTMPHGFADLHWRTAIKEVESCDDIDKLEAMHAEETRATVREAIERRMGELSV